MVHASCSLDGPGLVRHHFGNKLIIGEPSGEKTPRVRELAALLEKAGFEAVLSEQIQKDVWYKLWGNMTVNPISAITGATTDRVLDDELVRGFISQRDAGGEGDRRAHRHPDRPAARRTGTPSRASWAPSRPRCCRTWKPARRWSSTRW